MLISVIIPTYNRAHLVSRAIRSVIAQSYTQWELVIVDDGSTDDTEKVVHPFLTDTRIRYHKKNNSGAGHSRNVGAGLAKGDYITFLDSDDEATNGWLEKYAEKIVSRNAKVCCCGMVTLDAEGNVQEEIYPEKMGPILNSKVGRFTGGVFILRREIFLAVGGYDDKLRSGQHTELALRLLPYFDARGIEIENIFEPLIRVHLHSGERIRNDFPAKIAGVEYVLAKHKTLFDRNPLTKSTYLTNLAYCFKKTKEYRKALYYYMQAFMTYPSPKKFLRILFFFK